MNEIVLLPKRECDVPGYGRILVVQHVVRCDSYSNGSHTHGWQVRYGPRPWRFFSDHGESARLSLHHAMEHLASIYAGPKLGLKTAEMARKREPTGHVGVRVVLAPKHADKNVIQTYVEAQHPRTSNRPKRWYCGTQNTVTHERIAAGIAKAAAWRAAETARLQAELTPKVRGKKTTVQRLPNKLSAAPKSALRDAFLSRVAQRTHEDDEEGAS
jgi:hypothetical protein